MGALTYECGSCEFIWGPSGFEPPCVGVCRAVLINCGGEDRVERREGDEEWSRK